MSKTESDLEIGRFFRSNLLAVRRAIYQQDFKKFAALESNAARVAFVLSYPEAYQLSVKVEKPMIKDRDGAIRLKEVGNKAFGRTEFSKALEMYSSAVLLAPSTGKFTKCLSMFYRIVINNLTHKFLIYVLRKKTK